jgi:hypothetical protein
MIQVLCICYNSQHSIHKTLKSWESHTDRFCILINGGINNDYSQFDRTLKELSHIQKEVIVHKSDFTTFADTRNRLIKLSWNIDYKYSIFIDDSFVLKHWEPLNNAEALQITITRPGISYKSVRIINNTFNLRYTGKIHETLDTQVRIDSGIIVEDVVYQSHVKRTNDRQLYDLSMTENAKTPRELYHRACTLLNLYKLGLRTRKEVIEALQLRIKTQSEDTQETMMAYNFLNVMHFI